MNDGRKSAWKRLRLSTRLNLIVDSILLGTMAAFVALDYAREREALIRVEAEELAIVGALTAQRLRHRLPEVTADELRAMAYARPEHPVAIHLVQDGAVVLSSSERAPAITGMTRLDWGEDYDVWRTSTGLAISLPYRPSVSGASAELFVETSLASVNRTLSGTLRLHVIHGVITVLAMMLGIGWVLRRAVLGPFARMVSAINVMERGTWELEVPLSYQDEVGVLTTAFNRMGKKLTRTAREFARAEKLASLALVSSRLRRELDSPLREIEAVSSRLATRELPIPDVRSAAGRICEAAARSRSAVEQLEEAFLLELHVTTELESRSATDDRAGSDDLRAAGPSRRS